MVTPLTTEAAVKHTSLLVGLTPMQSSRPGRMPQWRAVSTQLSAMSMPLQPPKLTTDWI